MVRPYHTIRRIPWLFVFMVLIFIHSACDRVPPAVQGNISFLLRDERGDVAPDTTASGIALFRPSPGSKIKALISLSGLEPGRHEEYHFVWLNPDGNEMFRKLESFEADKNTDRFSSTISIDPERDRDIGIYEVKLYRFRTLLDSSAFELRSRPVLRGVVEVEGDFTEPVESISRARMKDGARVLMRAVVEGLEPGLQEHLSVRWVGPDGGSVYTKNLDLLPDTSETILKSSISIDPDRKRDVGSYTVEICRDDSVLASASFELLPEQG